MIGLVPPARGSRALRAGDQGAGAHRRAGDHDCRHRGPAHRGRRRRRSPPLPPVARVPARVQFGAVLIRRRARPAAVRGDRRALRRDRHLLVDGPVPAAVRRLAAPVDSLNQTGHAACADGWPPSRSAINAVLDLALVPPLGAWGRSLAPPPRSFTTSPAPPPARARAPRGARPSIAAPSSRGRPRGPRRDRCRRAGGGDPRRNGRRRRPERPRRGARRGRRADGDRRVVVEPYRAPTGAPRHYSAGLNFWIRVLP